jgi:hypothetical protein
LTIDLNISIEAWDPTFHRSPSPASTTNKKDDDLFADDKQPTSKSWPRAHEWRSPLMLNDQYFVDEYNRICMLRGVNICGNSKLPTSPPGSTHLNLGFYFHRNVSFVGRPFPLSDAHEHFSRLRAWGLTFIRLLVPWESLEHSGPGIYDEEYISYLIQIIKISSLYGIKCFIGN